MIKITISRIFGFLAFLGGILLEFLRNSNIFPPKISIPLSILCFIIVVTTERIQGGKSSLKKKLEKADIISYEYATKIDKGLDMEKSSFPKFIKKEMNLEVKDNVYEGE